MALRMPLLYKGSIGFFRFGGCLFVVMLSSFVGLGIDIVQLYLSSHSLFGGAGGSLCTLFPF